MKGAGGAVVWEGASRFDGAPLALALTWQTANVKTGPMVQSWVLRTDVAPAEAMRTGDDASYCGECPRAGGHGCYVNVANAPQAVWRSLPFYERITPKVAARRLTGQKLRVGAYGDPAAVPASLWWTLLVREVNDEGALVFNVAGHTGYTHSPHKSPALRDLVMASCDSELEAVRWQAQGWRTYRVRGLDAEGNPEPLMAGERVCPASSEAGKKTACAWCLACDGSATPGRSIAIVDHSGVQLSRLARLRRSKEGAALTL